MIPVPVTLRSRAKGVPGCATQGYAPTPDCVLCVVQFRLWDANAKRWTDPDPNDLGYLIVHRPTGFYLGSGLGKAAPAEGDAIVWDALPEAMATLVACKPDFPAWPLAGENEAARLACRAMFKAACGAAA